MTKFDELLEKLDVHKTSTEYFVKDEAKNSNNDDKLRDKSNRDKAIKNIFR